MEEINLGKVLITGSAGMVGSYIDFGIKTDKELLDITDFDAVQKCVADHKPTAIIHLAAETDMGACEKNPERAYFINSVGTYNVACAAKELGVKMVYVSTNAVFDGLDNGPFKESDAPLAQSVYGKSKHLGELAVQGVSEDYLIIRTSWIFGGGPEKDKKFVKKIIDQLGGAEIRAVSDQVGSTTFAKDLVLEIKNLVAHNQKGIFHIVNKGECSRFSIAKEIARIVGSDSAISPVSASVFNSNAKIGINEGLLSGTRNMRPWQEALKDYLEIEWESFLLK